MKKLFGKPSSRQPDEEAVAARLEWEPGMQTPTIRTMDELAVLLQQREALDGTSEYVLLRVEDMLGGPLPDVYRHFLLTLSKPTGKFMVGATLYHGTPDLLTPAAVALLEKHGGPLLPYGAFVFCIFGDRQLAFFKWNEGEDPPVHFYDASRGQTMFEVVTTTLTEFFILQAVHAYPDIATTPPVQNDPPSGQLRP